MSSVINIESKEEFDNLIASSGSKLIIVDFHAEWCPPCKAMKPVFEEIAKEFEGKAIFVKVDVDVADEISAACEISCMPTFQYFKNGQKVGEV